MPLVEYLQNIRKKFGQTLLAGRRDSDEHAISELLQLRAEIASLEREVEVLSDRYEILTENLAASVVIRDAFGEVCYCSPYTEVLTGYSLREINDYDGDFFTSIIQPSDRESFRKALQVCQLGERYLVRYRFMHAQGFEMWAETRIVPIVDDSGDVASTLAITLDVTASVRYQKKIEAQNRDLEDFSYMISHDLKSPIYTIKGMLNLIHEDCEESLTEDIEEPLQHIARSVNRLEALVGGVLEYSQISRDSSHDEVCELSTVLQDVISDYESHLKEVGGEILLSEKFPRVRGDSLRLYQIFSNLIGNAIKYRDEERVLSIRVEEISSPAAHYTFLTVSDNGLGIPEERISEIFRPFQRAHGQEIEGTGIGLACVQKLVEQIGGKVEVVSRVGQGSVFTVMLRRAEGAKRTPEVTQQS